MKKSFSFFMLAFACLTILLTGQMLLCACKSGNTDNRTHVNNLTSLETALKNGGDIVLDNDITGVNKTFEITKNTNINLNNKKIEADASLKNTDANKIFAMFSVKGAKLSVGGGTIDAKNTWVFAVISEYKVSGETKSSGVKNSSLEITSGKYIAGDNNTFGDGADPCVVYLIGDTSTCKISGGEFSVSQGFDDTSWILNIYDSSRSGETGKAKFSVSGGTFKGFDPEHPTHEGSTSFLADGYKVDNSTDGYYKVVKK